METRRKAFISSGVLCAGLLAAGLYGGAARADEPQCVSTGDALAELRGKDELLGYFVRPEQVARGVAWLAEDTGDPLFATPDGFMIVARESAYEIGVPVGGYLCVRYEKPEAETLALLTAILDTPAAPER